MPRILLKSLKYSENLGENKDWSLDIPLSKVNLLVGKNATGKTRTLNVIAGLSRLLTSTPKFMVSNGSYNVLFDDSGVELKYIVKVENSLVVDEQYFIGEERVLYRGAQGEGEIKTYSKESDPNMVRFSPPENELAATVRRDAIQHPYLECLHEWAQSTRHYSFSSTLGKNSLALIVKDGPEADDRDSNQVVGIFRKAQREFGGAFVDSVIQDMSRMRYEIDSLEIVTPGNMKLLQDGQSTNLSCIGIKEEGLNRVINQTEMSDGMFSALSILIQVNYSQLANRASCILIDDIGEGLDFERSTQLIDILRQKSAVSSFQLIMTTNDKFVMNEVPLQEWLVLQRQGGNVSVKNYENSKKLFDDFRFTGLSNFSFLEMDIVNDVNGEKE